MQTLAVKGLTATMFSPTYTEIYHVFLKNIFLLSFLPFSFSSRFILELKFAIHHRATLVDVSFSWKIYSGITLPALVEDSLTGHLFKH